MAGLEELFHAPNRPIMIMWYISILTACGAVFYYSSLLIKTHLSQGQTFDHTQLDDKRIPFPKIMICAPTGINKTWINDHFYLAPKERRKFENFTEEMKREFIDTFTALSGATFEYVLDKSFDPTHPLYTMYSRAFVEHYNRLIPEPRGQNRLDFTGSLPSCEKTVSDCKINGKQYDCCKGILYPQADHYGSCFDLGADLWDPTIYSIDSPSKPPTFQFDVRMDWDQMASTATMNGFFVYLSETTAGAIGTPITVPAGMHVIIELSRPTYRKHRWDCIAGPMPNTVFGPYDPEGYNCISERFMKEVEQKWFGCQYIYGSYYPDKNVMCTGAMHLPIQMYYSYSYATRYVGALEKYRNPLLEIFSRKSKCQSFCEAWEYHPKFSYSELISADFNSPDAAFGNVSRSRVTVKIGSSTYMQREENPLLRPYDTFLRIAEVTGLYLGCSIITFAEITFYGIRLIYGFVKTVKRTKKVGDCTKK